MVLLIRNLNSSESVMATLQRNLGFLGSIFFGRWPSLLLDVSLELPTTWFVFALFG